MLLLLLNIAIHDILAQLGVKVLCVRNEGEKGTVVKLWSVTASVRRGEMNPYYRLTSTELVEMEDALNAEHVVESASGIQFCASVTEVDDASRPSKKGFLMAFALLFDRFELRRFWCKAILMVSQTSFIKMLAWSQGWLRYLSSIDVAGGVVAYSRLGSGSDTMVPASPTLPKPDPGNDGSLNRP